MSSDVLKAAAHTAKSRGWRPVLQTSRIHSNKIAVYSPNAFDARAVPSMRLLIFAKADSREVEVVSSTNGEQFPAIALFQSTSQRLSSLGPLVRCRSCHGDLRLLPQVSSSTRPTRRRDLWCQGDERPRENGSSASRIRQFGRRSSACPLSRSASIRVGSRRIVPAACSISLAHPKQGRIVVYIVLPEVEIPKRAAARMAFCSACTQMQRS